MGRMVGGCREGRVGETQWRDENATRLRRMSQTEQVKRATTVWGGVDYVIGRDHSSTDIDILFV